MNPTLCRYTSEVFYEGRLAPHLGRERLAVSGGGSLSGVGLGFISVPHEGRRSDSLEEAEEVARLVHELLTPGAQWIDKDAKCRLGLDGGGSRLDEDALSGRVANPKQTGGYVGCQVYGNCVRHVHRYSYQPDPNSSPSCRTIQVCF